MIHVDVKKLGNIPDGGGWRYVGRQQGRPEPGRDTGQGRNEPTSNPKMGTAFVHTVIDDHSRVAYAEIHDDETAATAIGVLRRAVSWFAARGVTVERVLSDNGSAYKSHAWRDACAELGITAKKTRPYRPQTNGKIERFHRTLADGWAFSRHYNSESARRAALPGLAPRLQSPPAPHRHRQGPTHHPVNQPAWAVQLALQPGEHGEHAPMVGAGVLEASLPKIAVTFFSTAPTPMKSRSRSRCCCAPPPSAPAPRVRAA